MESMVEMSPPRALAHPAHERPKWMEGPHRRWYHSVEEAKSDQALKVNGEKEKRHIFSHFIHSTFGSNAVSIG